MHTVLTSVQGFPRIGANRELKKVIERYWKKDATLEEVRQVAKDLRKKHWKIQTESGIELIPSNDFSYYDQMLDTAILLGAVPERYKNLEFENAEDTLFAIARGYQGERGDVTALPMKKWFTTNYHYIVPEVENPQDLHLAGTKPFDEFNEAKALGIETKPVLIGPYTFLKLARTPQAQELEANKETIEALANAYCDIVKRFASLGAKWLQFDEPYLCLDKEDGDLRIFSDLYNPILQSRFESADNAENVKILLNTYFGNILDSYKTLNDLAFDAIGLDFVEGKEENLEALQKYGVNEKTTIFAGVVNGRNIWKNDYAQSLGLLDALQKNVTNRIAVSTACSLLHVPFSTDGEELGEDVLKHFAFAVEKLKEVSEIAKLCVLNDDELKNSEELAQNQALFDGSRVKVDENVKARIASLKPEDFERKPSRAERQK
nr:5-methyltetrahydropteroyltriglutamate--homocysteine S-methyltransferase [Gardnerella vaginalis]